MECVFDKADEEETTTISTREGSELVLRVLVCGDRNWIDIPTIRSELSRLPSDTVIIHGDARGADRLGGYVAGQLGMPVVPFPADWNQYGKAAGPIRNVRMLTEGKPDLVLAFHPDLRASKGTAHMVRIAKEAGIEVRVLPESKN